MKCGCKGARYCALCLDSDRVKALCVPAKSELSEFHSFQKFIRCLKCGAIVPLEEKKNEGSDVNAGNDKHGDNAENGGNNGNGINAGNAKNAGNAENCGNDENGCNARNLSSAGNAAEDSENSSSSKVVPSLRTGGGDNEASGDRECRKSCQLFTISATRTSSDHSTAIDLCPASQQPANTTTKQQEHSSPALPDMGSLFQMSENCRASHKPVECVVTNFRGLMLVQDFVSAEVEARLVQQIDAVPWAQSQSGRRKQDYGPRVNFKHQKVKLDRFVGMPDYADEILGRMKRIDESKLGNYQPFELCNLEYDSARQSAIEFHRDDMWIWGNRLISINLLAGSVMTFVNRTDRRMVFVPMPRRSLLCMADEVRYAWEHGILPGHISGRRIALTMREPSDRFQPGGELYEKYGQELVRLGNLRIPV